MAPVQRAEIYSWKDMIVIKLITWSCVRLHFRHYIFPRYSVETQLGYLTWKSYTERWSAWFSARLRYSLGFQSDGRL